jgi:SAM-dependent methyltransferase/uncharacterized protein YbaR (Trm112 family)
MRPSLIDKLRCPVDSGPLALDAQRPEADGHVMEGKLRCSVCGANYPVKDGIPHLLPSASASVNGQSLAALQEATIERFGFEWRYFKDWGWLEDYPNVENAEELFFGGLLEHSKRAFWSKSLFQKDELHQGLTVLDAGCGNGRFTQQAALTGAEVYGIDLGWGVQSAFEHTRALPNAHILRGDLFRPPFADATFDRIFSIGVLMHTGNAGAAFDSLVGKLKPGGLIVAHVYGKGCAGYEIIDRAVRTVTVRLPIPLQMSFARVTARIARWLRSGPEWRRLFYERLFSHINLLPTTHHMFDWWSAPIATHHSLEEIQGWFERNGIEVLRTNPPLGDSAAESKRRRGHGAITMLGRLATCKAVL